MAGDAALPILRRARLSRKADKAGISEAFLLNMLILAHSRSARYEGITCHQTGKPSRLSRQQAGIIRLMAKGLTNKAICEHMNLSIHTVKYHARAAYAKLEVNSAGEAILKARALGYIE